MATDTNTLTTDGVSYSIKEYDDIPKIEVLYHIATNSDDLKFEAASAGLKLINEHKYGIEYFKALNKIITNGNGATGTSPEKSLRLLEQGVEKSVKKYQDRLDFLAETLRSEEGNDDEDGHGGKSEFTAATKELRDCSFRLSILYLANNEYTNAFATLNILAPHYPGSEYTFRDYERLCFISYISKRFEKFDGLKSKLDDLYASTKKYKTRVSKEEAISFWKIRWSILMANFQLERYESVKKLFIKLIKAETIEGVSALEVLNSSLISKADIDYDYNCDNYITRRDVLLAVIFSSLASSSDKDIKAFIKNEVVESFFEEDSFVLNYVQSLMQKKFSDITKWQTKIENDSVKHNYNISLANWNHIKQMIRLRLFLFYFSFIDQVGVKDMADRLHIAESELFNEVLELIQILNLNITYDPIQEAFVNSDKGIMRQCEDFSVVHAKLKADCESTIVQSLVLRGLSEK